jgi:hypothetical protein
MMPQTIKLRAQRIAIVYRFYSPGLRPFSHSADVIGDTAPVANRAKIH